MKRVTVFVGSARKKHTYQAVAQFLGHLQALGQVEAEVVPLSNYHLQTCRGCGACCEKGEAFCPLKDDRDALLAKISASDGIVFASPNYCGQVSGIMKIFLDRFVFLCHRPRYFGKVCTSIITQSIGGGDQIVKYLDILAGTLGFNVAKGVCVTVLDPGSEQHQQRVDRALAKLAARFYPWLAEPAYPAPSLMNLMVFRVARRMIRETLDESNRDYQYFDEHGWFTSNYYYPARLGPIKRGAGSIFDALAARMIRAQ